MVLKKVTHIKHYETEKEIVEEYNRQISERPSFKKFLEASKNMELERFKQNQVELKEQDEKRRNSSPIDKDITAWIEDKKTLAIEELCLGYPLAVLKFESANKTRVIEGKNWNLECEGHPRFGHLQVRDMDLLYVLMTLGYEDYNNQTLRGEKPLFPSRIKISPYQLLKAIGKNVSSRDYNWLKEALDRLSTAKFNFKNDRRVEGFRFLSPFSWEEDYNGDIKRLEITFDLTFLKMVDKQNTKFFKMPQETLKDRNVTRKLHLGILRVNKNPKKPWKILEQDLTSLLGTEQKSLNRFRQYIKQICDDRGFPCFVTIEKHPSTGNWSYTFKSRVQ